MHPLLRLAVSVHMGKAPIRDLPAGRLGQHGRLEHVHVANILWHLPFGHELMHLGLQTMGHRHLVPLKYRPDITDREWDKLDGTLPDPTLFDDLSGGTDGTRPPPIECRP